jgi:cytochrome c
MKTLILAATLSLAAAASMAASASPGANPAFKEEEARKMTQKAAIIVDAMGKEEMMMRIHSADPDKVRGTLAVTMRDLYTGIVLAHPRGPKFTGTDNAGNDPAKRLHPRDVIELAKASGKGRVGDTWIERVGDVVLEAGIQD